MLFYGIDINQGIISLAILKKLGRGFIVNDLFLFDTSNVDDVKRLYTLLHENRKRIVTALDSHQIISKSVTIEKKRLFSALEKPNFAHLFNLEIPEKILAYALSRTNKRTHYCVYLTSKLHINSHLEQYRCSNIEPDIISSHTQAAYNFIKTYLPQQKNLLVIVLHQQAPFFLKIRNGIIEKSSLLSVFQKSNDAKQLAIELDKALTTIYLDEKEKNTMPVCFLANQNHFEEPINNFVSKHQLHQIKLNQADQGLMPFSIAIGLALDPLINKKPLQLRPDNRPSSSQKMAFAKKIILSCCFSVLLSLSILVIGRKAIQKKQERLNQYIHNFADIKNRLFGPNPAMELSYNPHELISELLIKSKKTFPYLPLRYTLSDVFNAVFLSQGYNNDALSIIKFDYDLVSFPRIGAPQSKNILRVSLEINFKNSDELKIFKNYILKDCAIIDYSKKIQWKQENTSTVIQFYLKEKPLKESFVYESIRKNS